MGACIGVAFVAAALCGIWVLADLLGNGRNPKGAVRAWLVAAAGLSCAALALYLVGIKTQFKDYTYTAIFLAAIAFVIFAFLAIGASSKKR